MKVEGIINFAWSRYINGPETSKEIVIDAKFPIDDPDLNEEDSFTNLAISVPVNINYPIVEDIPELAGKTITISIS